MLELLSDRLDPTPTASVYRRALVEHHTMLLGSREFAPHCAVHQISVVPLNFRDESRANWGTTFPGGVVLASKEAIPGTTRVHGPVVLQTVVNPHTAAIDRV